MLALALLDNQNKKQYKMYNRTNRVKINVQKINDLNFLVRTCKQLKKTNNRDLEIQLKINRQSKTNRGYS